VVVASGAAALAGRSPAGRPRLDLARAVALQLAACGVERPRVVGGCTRCDAERLWSYRRDGRAAGRNLALIWRRGRGRG
jgi:copper oxidase (laccase) domain-containing protein